eukprot:3474072-Prymnesium_polylepis.1
MSSMTDSINRGDAPAFTKRHASIKCSVFFRSAGGGAAAATSDERSRQTPAGAGEANLAVRAQQRERLDRIAICVSSQEGGS